MRVVAVVFFVLCARSAAADEVMPWAAGIPQETQDAVNALYAEGNQLFARDAHTAALVRYRAAIELWDHPLVRFNMAVTLVKLERFVEAADELERALRFGRQPFDDALYARVQQYQALLGGRIQRVRRHSHVRTTWLLGGVAGATLAAGVGLGAYANWSYDQQFENGRCMTSRDNDARVCNSEGFAATDRARTLGNVGTVMAITSVLVAGVAVYIYIAAPRDRVIIAPVASPQDVGVAVVGSF